MTLDEVMDLLVAIGCSPEQIAQAVKLVAMRVPALPQKGGAVCPVKLPPQPENLAVFFARFWSVWPHKVGKPAAERAFRRVAGEVEDILAGVERYVATKPPDRPWLNPATFLNQRRWEDQPAPVALQIYDTRKDGLALLMQEVRRHEQQSEVAGRDVRRLSVLSPIGGDACGDDQDVSGSAGNLF